MGRRLLMLLAFVLIATGTYGLLSRKPTEPEVVQTATTRIFPRLASSTHR